MCSNPYYEILNPRAATFFPGKEYHPPIFNPRAPKFLPAYILSSVSDEAETAAEATENSESFYSATEDTSSFDVGLCMREELHFSDDGKCVKLSGLLPADEKFDSPSCSIAIAPDDIEYENQSTLFYQDPNIHHFNWMGEGVMVKTSTPAAVSLTVILMRAPVRLVDEGNLRDQTILREAMLTIDPVVYYGDINHVRKLTGEALHDAAIGAASVCYSPFGQWQNDAYGEGDERPLTDELDMPRHTEGTTIVNGWLENSAPTRQEYWSEAEEAYKSVVAIRKKVVEERKLFGVGHTPLRKSLAADGSELIVPAKQTLPGDASGLITTVMLCQMDTMPSPLKPPVREDGLFRNTNWADDLDDEDIIDITRARTLSSPNDLVKNVSWADELDAEDEIVTIINAPNVDQPTASLSPMILGEQAPKKHEQLRALVPESKTVGNTKPIKSIEGPAHFRPVISGTGEFRFRYVVSIPLTARAESMPEKPLTPPDLSSNSSFSHALEPCSDAELEAEEEELYGYGSGASSRESWSSDESFAPSPNSSSLIAEEPVASAAGETGTLQGRPQDEIDEDDDLIYGSNVAGTELAKLPALTPFILPSRPKPGDQVEPRQFALLFRTKPVPQIKPTQLTLPIRTQLAEPSRTPIANSIPDYTTSDYIRQGQDLMASIRMSFLPKAAKISQAFTTLKGKEDGLDQVDGKADEVEEVSHVKGVVDQVEQHGIQQDNEESNGKLPSTTPQAVLTAPTTSDSPTCSPSDSWDKLPAVVSSLGCKEGQNTGKIRFVACDDTRIVMPKFSLVPASMTAMIRTHAEILEGIEEGDEDQTENETASNMGGQFAKLTEEAEAEAEEEEEEGKEEGEIGAEVDLKRSVSAGSLAALEDGSGLDPATPDQSPMPLPCKQPESNALYAMLGKRHQLSLPGNKDDGSEAEELIGTKGIGAIFEEGEEEILDDSNILSGAVLNKSGIASLQASLASRSFAALLDAGTDSGSGSICDDVFTAPSAGTTAPTTTEGIEDGSPSPGIIVRPAQPPNLVAEPWPETAVGSGPATTSRVQPAVQKRKSSWATIKHNLNKRPSGGTALAVDLQFLSIQRPAPSWTKVENKLQKPAPQVTANPNRKNSSFRQALKKVTTVLVKGIKALA